MTDTDSDTEGETETGDATGSNRSKTELALYVGRLLWKFVRVLARAAVVGGSVLLALVRDDGQYTGVRTWFLLSGNRWHLVAPLVVGVFLGSLVLGMTDVIGVRESSFVTTMFSTIVAGLFSFVPIVVSVNNLTVSRLFDSPASLRERVEGVSDFRSSAAALAPGVAVADTDPAGFLTTVVDAAVERCDDVAEAADAIDSGEVVGADSADVAAAIRRYVGGVRAELAPVADTLEGSRPQLFDLLVPMMNAEFSRHTVDARRLRATAELSEPLCDGLSDLEEMATVLDVTRQYFKAVYLQQELAAFSRYITYSGVTAFLTSSLVIMIYASGYPAIESETLLLVFVTFSLAVAFSPFAILFAYIVRIATVVKRTSAPGAFTPQGERPSHVR